MLCSYRFIIAVTIACFVVVAADHLKLPAGIKTCKRNADDFSSCLRLAIQESWPIFIKSIPEFGIPVLDPFFEEFNEFVFGSKDLKGKISTENLYFYGFKDVKFTATRPNYIDNKFNLEVDLSMPRCFVEGKLNVNANLASFKLNGKSNFNITLEDVKVTWYLIGSVINDTWVIEKYYPRPQIHRFKIWADDFFNGSPELTKVVLDFINEFWPTMYPEAIPFVEDVWNKKYTPMVNNFFSRVSFDEVFPPS